MIKCCNGCQARRLRCHVWGECVHYMQERSVLDERQQERMKQNAGAYGMAESYAVNPHFRDTFRRGKKGQNK